MAAVEFALIAPWFFWLMVGLGELTMIGLAQTSLDFALSETARQIRTGELQAAGLTEQQFKNNVCNEMIIGGNCGAMSIDVRSYQGFADVQIDSPIDPATGQLRTNFAFQPGQASNIVVVRAFYNWDVVTPLFQGMFANIGTQRVLASTVLFRNEPF
ncbi:MAG: TadE/TadG family type IV pilus assembly protein [Caulobacterales bacterium]